jgi:DNA-binding NtrC family response regulator
VARQFPRSINDEKLLESLFLVLIDGLGGLPVAMDAINTGHVYRFLTKPFDAGDLATIIREALKQRETAQQKKEPNVETQAKRVNDSHVLHRTHAQFASDSEVRCSINGTPLTTGISDEFFENVGKPGFTATIKRSRLFCAHGGTA